MSVSGDDEEPGLGNLLGQVADEQPRGNGSLAGQAWSCLFLSCLAAPPSSPFPALRHPPMDDENRLSLPSGCHTTRDGPHGSPISAVGWSELRGAHGWADGRVVCLRIAGETGPRGGTGCTGYRYRVICFLCWAADHNRPRQQRNRRLATSPGAQDQQTGQQTQRPRRRKATPPERHGVSQCRRKRPGAHPPFWHPNSRTGVAFRRRRPHSVSSQARVSQSVSQHRRRGTNPFSQAPLPQIVTLVAASPAPVCLLPVYGT